MSHANECLCFSFNQWVPEITHHCPNTLFLLVGTKVDLRDEQATVEELAKNQQKPISFEMGEKMAEELKAVKYVECSALTQRGLLKLFEEVILASFHNKPSSRSE